MDDARRPSADLMTRGACAKTEAEQVEFFQGCHDRFLRARDSAGEVRHFLRVGGWTVCLTFAGPSLVPHLIPALDHLRVPIADAPADLTLCVWDSLSTATKMPSPPFRRENLTRRGEIWGFTSPRIKTGFHWDESSVNLLDHATRTAVYWVPEAAALPYWVRSAPFRTLFHWWFENRGCQLLHAAAVGSDDRAVLLVGKGGAGKSTAALSCLRSGLRYLADDYLVVRLRPEPRAYSLYSTAKLNADHLANFPEFRALVRNVGTRDGEKAVIYLHPTFARQIATDLPLRAILAPQITGRDKTALRPASTWDIQRAIAFETMSQLPHVGGYTHDTICRLASMVPGYTLDLGRRLDEIPAAITELLWERTTRREEPGASAAACAAENPLVSVVICLFNGERFVADAVRNVLSQKYPAVELIVVDAGPTGATGNIDSGLPCDIRYFQHEHPGLASARNRGIREAAGEIIAFLGVDDHWPENTLASLVGHLLREPDLEVVGGDDRPLTQDSHKGQAEHLGNPEEAFCFSTGAALYRKSVFARIGLFDPAAIAGDDSEWFRRARESGVKMRRIDDVTLLTGRRGLIALRVFKTVLDRRRAMEAPAGGRQ